jgi:hypothetical protein
MGGLYIVSEINSENDTHWLKEFPDENMSAVLEPEVEK